MQCPFLRKMNVKFCSLCPTTMIPMSGKNLAAEQCSGPEFDKCPLLQERYIGPQAMDRCPFLSVGDVHYCEVAPFQKLIPCNQTTASRCTNEGHKYCQLYLSMTESDEPTGVSDIGIVGAAGQNDYESEIPMPENLAYAPNHMWIDLGDELTCHVGVDAFFTRTLGEVDDVIYLYHGGNRWPIVRFKVGNVDYDLVFPSIIQGIEINAHLVADPMEVMRDPYGRGWLFEGITLPVPRNDAAYSPEAGLMRGAAARHWMNEECEHLGKFIHEHHCEHTRETGLLVQDGGCLRGPMARLLDRPALIRLHSEFFTLRAGRTQP